LNQGEYQRSRRQLDEELRVGMEMLHAGHQAKVAALDARWEEEAAPAAASHPAMPEPRPEPAPAASQPRRREPGDLQTDVEAALALLGEEFRKSDLCRALGYEPHRSSLHRVFRELQKEGIVEIGTPGLGGRASFYRKIRQPTPS
jgi:uncharacterized membrane protein